MNKIKTFSAFSGTNLIVTGPLQQLLEAVWTHIQKEPESSILIFDNSTGRQTDFNFTGSLDEVITRTVPQEKSKKGPGRPKLGVVCGEVSLMPRHWEWLEKQPKKASGTIRSLIENASKEISPEQLKKQTIEAAGNFMWAIGGNLPGFEEASRALYAGKWQVFDALAAPWPEDVVSHMNLLLDPVRRYRASGKWFENKYTQIPALKNEYTIQGKPADPRTLSAVKLAGAVNSKKLTATEIAESFKAEMETDNELTNEFIKQAEEIDRRIKNGENPGPLAGVPFTADTESPAVLRLQEAGAVYIGKNRKNYEPAEVSSSISAPMHICIDICGSLRVSAVRKAFAGLKPSTGRLASNSGVLPDSVSPASQQATVDGFIAASVADLHLAFQAAAGPDAVNPLALPVPVSGPDIPVPFKVGIIKKPGGQQAETKIAAAVDDAAGIFARLGYEIIETDLPELNSIARACISMMLAEHKRKALLPQNFIMDIIQTADDTDLDGYIKLMTMRQTWTGMWADFFREFPVVIAPVLTSLKTESGIPEQTAESMRICTATSFMGVPSVAVPSRSNEGNFYGIQIISGMYREDLCLKTAAVIEAETGGFSSLKQSQ